jgi:hypothetical protein
LKLAAGEKRHKKIYTEHFERGIKYIQENMYKTLSVFKISRSRVDEIYTNM